MAMRFSPSSGDRRVAKRDRPFATLSTLFAAPAHIIDELLLGVHAQLAVDAVGVGLHRVDADVELLSDVLLRVALRQAYEHLGFTLRERVLRGDGLAGALELRYGLLLVDLRVPSSFDT